MGKSSRRAAGGKRSRVSEAAGSPEAKTESISFESALEQLEGTVDRLEAGEMPLEEALELFETGVKLSRQCSTTLEQAERRIEILVADREGAQGANSIPFESDEEWDDTEDTEDTEDTDGTDDTDDEDVGESFED